jgi:D-sedoheptulose 7-phosphate isomerase
MEDQVAAVDLLVSEYISRVSRLVLNIDVGLISDCAGRLWQAAKSQKRIFVIGNGGSASTASHFACDLNKLCNGPESNRTRAFALGEQLAVLTAIANDLAYEKVFEEQFKVLADPGDILIAISTSGNSPNVVAAVEYARQLGCSTISLTGASGGMLGALADIDICCRCPCTSEAEDCHLIVMHCICKALATYSLQES